MKERTLEEQLKLDIERLQNLRTELDTHEARTELDTEIASAVENYQKVTRKSYHAPPYKKIK